jgi:MFS family permease
MNFQRSDYQMVLTGLFTAGGLNMIVDVIISDLVPLRERGNFIAIVLTVYSIGTTLGPFVGGAIVETTTWRWVFYLNGTLKYS